MPGANYEDIAQAEIDHHEAENDPRSSEDLLFEHLEKHQLPEHTTERRWSNGRWALIREHRTFDGSTVVLYTDVTDMKRREKKLRRVNQQLDIALKNMAQGLCVFDAEHRMVLANQKYSKIFQLPEELTQAGVTVNDQMDRILSAFKFDGPVAKALVQERLKHIDNKELCTYFLTFPEGRTVEVMHQPIAGGGSVETFSEW